MIRAVPEARAAWTATRGLVSALACGSVLLLVWSADITAARLDWGVLAMFVLVSLLGALASGVRWCLCAQWFGGAISMQRALHWHFEASAIGLIIPTAVGGDCYRVARLCGANGTAFLRSAVSSVLLARLVGLASILAVILPAVTCGLGLVGFTCFTLGMVVTSSVVHGIAGALSEEPRRHSVRQTAMCVIPSILVQLARLWLLARILSGSASVTQTGLGVLAMEVASVFPIGVGGVGTADLAFIKTLTALGTDQTTATVALVYQRSGFVAVSLSGIVVTGAASLLRSRW